MNGWLHPTAATAPLHLMGHMPSYSLPPTTNLQQQPPLHLLSYIDTIRKLGMINNHISSAMPAAHPQPVQSASSVIAAAAAAGALSAPVEQVPAACPIQAMQNLINLSNNAAGGEGASASGFNAALPTTSLLDSTKEYQQQSLRILERN